MKLLSAALDGDKQIGVLKDRQMLAHLSLPKIPSDATDQASVKPFEASARNLAPSVTAPCKALGERIDLVVVAPGKSE